MEMEMWREEVAGRELGAPRLLALQTSRVSAGEKVSKALLTLRKADVRVFSAEKRNLSGQLVIQRRQKARLIRRCRSLERLVTLERNGIRRAEEETGKSKVELRETKVSLTNVNKEMREMGRKMEALTTARNHDRNAKIQVTLLFSSHLFSLSPSPLLFLFALLSTLQGLK